ncbi:DUF3892 domain-containing protein [Oenococcus sicerae]|uniref:DUF3892 domain-containing protein n=1 Tax=Oenococcus sicerae TaxID=2203724 RepID=A0ABX5QKN3_9LACO|nr:DUF3892 domain-containing protein [Oenococcus sicerae]QAS69323.1 DUF3892 domain-containing protein [Oenococcus sicerae]
MAKLADYLIYEVHYEDEPYRRHIAEVHAQKDLGETVDGEQHSFSKDEVVFYIENANLRQTFATIYFLGGKWHVGEQVIVETINGEKFIKTERDGTKVDNLGDLRTY